MSDREYPERFVFPGKNRGDVYHTGRCCVVIGSKATPIPIDDRRIDVTDLEECKHCAGAVERTGGHPVQYTPDIPDPVEQPLPEDNYDRRRSEAQRLAADLDAGPDPLAGAAERGGYVRGERDGA